jgi:hypothetical protein
VAQKFTTLKIEKPYIARFKNHENFKGVEGAKRNNFPFGLAFKFSTNWELRI